MPLDSKPLTPRETFLVAMLRRLGFVPKPIVDITTPPKDSGT
jgi:hypothetical protein